MNILVAEIKDFSETVVEKLKTIGPTTLKNITEDRLQEAFRTYEVFWFRLGFIITNELLADPKRKVKIIICAVTGLDHIDMEACQANNVTVLSLKNETDFLKSVRATAEHTLAITLALLRHIPDAVIATRKGVWNREPFKGREIMGKTVGIIGAGRLGSIVTEYFKCFGTNVRVHDINYQNSDTDLNDLLRQSDIISLHINYAKSNLNFMGAKYFQLMKNTAFFINTSRGSLVDEQALVDAIKNNEIAGCACDVIYDEFNLNNSPLLPLAKNLPDKVLLTPHIGGNTFESFDKTENFMLDKLIKKLKEKVKNV